MGRESRGIIFSFRCSDQWTCYHPLLPGSSFILGNPSLLHCAAELNRAQVAFVSPADLGPDEAGKMRDDHFPGDIGFDPLGLKPEDPEEFDLMVTKELQNGRLAMLAAAGFLAQEAVDGKGILEHLGF